ncbi:MAG: rhamnogalacturonan acetylesterase [Lachnospiraceae bacterium]|nr:rhamnogalacturonan acetylesterase [Lachnospiraceae bacterium]
MRVIQWAGDSINTTNKYKTYPQTGIAQAFDRYTKEDVVIYNHAINGRSTKSFIDQNRLAVIYDELSSGEYLFIQFGHNDEKKADPLRYTDPQGEYKDNLAKFVNVARDRGAHPLFITPLERRQFLEDGTLKTPSDHEPYVIAMKETAAELEVPLVDLFSKSREFLIKTGPEETKQYFMNLAPGEVDWCPEGKLDNSHLRYEGAMLFGRMVAEGLLDIGGIYADLLADPEELRNLSQIEDNG